MSIAEQCLIPNTGYTPAPCAIEDNGGDANQARVFVKVRGKELGIVDNIHGTLLYERRNNKAPVSSPAIQAELFWLDELQNKINTQDEAAWGCYRQLSGSLSVCIPNKSF